MSKKLLIIGHGRHGKDTVGELLRDYHGRSFASSSEFVCTKSIWPTINEKQLMEQPTGFPFYMTEEMCFADRSNHRAKWADLITEYNTPDKTRTASEMLSDGLDMYVGMRRRDELEACKAINLFDEIIWVDRSEHLPPEPLDSMELVKEDATIYLDNNGTLRDLWRTVDAMVIGGMI